MRRLWVAPVLVGGLLLLLFLALRSGEDRRSFTFSPSTKLLPSVGSVVVARLGSLGPGFEGASPATTRAAEKIAEANATVARLVRLGDGRRVGGVGPWRGFGGRLRGAVLGFSLKRPLAVDLDLPYVAVPPDAPSHGQCATPYSPGLAHLRASGVTALMALVDLRRNQVVQISTDAKRGKVGPVAGKPYPSCNEG
jgi:hypothetical protein